MKPADRNRSCSCSAGDAFPPVQEICYKITGCAIDILNTLGPGLDAGVYAECLKIEMDKRGIAYRQNCVFPLFYGGGKVGEVVVPFIVGGRLIAECFSSDAFNETDHSQFVSYLRAAELPMALLLNFQYGKLQWKKILSEKI